MKSEVSKAELLRAKWFAKRYLEAVICFAIYLNFLFVSKILEMFDRGLGVPDYFFQVVILLFLFLMLFLFVSRNVEKPVLSDSEAKSRKRILQSLGVFGVILIASLYFVRAGL